MSRTRIVLLVVLLAAIAVGGVYGYRAYSLYQLEKSEEAAFQARRAAWNFDPNDPSLVEARFLATDGASSVSLGFPTIEMRGNERVVVFPPTNATFLDMGAQQIHMASKPDATLKDIPLGSTVKVRISIGSTTDPHAIYIYDILVVQ